MQLRDYVPAHFSKSALLALIDSYLVESPDAKVADTESQREAFAELRKVVSAINTSPGAEHLDLFPSELFAVLHQFFTVKDRTGQEFNAKFFKLFRKDFGDRLIVLCMIMEEYNGFSEENFYSALSYSRHPNLSLLDRKDAFLQLIDRLKKLNYLHEHNFNNVFRLAKHHENPTITLLIQLLAVLNPPAAVASAASPSITAVASASESKSSPVESDCGFFTPEIWQVCQEQFLFSSEKLWGRAFSDAFRFMLRNEKISTADKFAYVKVILRNAQNLTEAFSSLAQIQKILLGLIDTACKDEISKIEQEYAANLDLTIDEDAREELARKKDSDVEAIEARFYDRKTKVEVEYDGYLIFLLEKGRTHLIGPSIGAYLEKLDRTIHLAHYGFNFPALCQILVTANLKWYVNFVTGSPAIESAVYKLLGEQLNLLNKQTNRTQIQIFVQMIESEIELMTACSSDLKYLADVLYRLWRELGFYCQRNLNPMFRQMLLSYPQEIWDMMQALPYEQLQGYKNRLPQLFVHFATLLQQHAAAASQMILGLEVDGGTAITPTALPELICDYLAARPAGVVAAVDSPIGASYRVASAAVPSTAATSEVKPGNNPFAVVHTHLASYHLPLSRKLLLDLVKTCIPAAPTANPPNLSSHLPAPVAQALDELDAYFHDLENLDPATEQWELTLQQQFTLLKILLALCAQKETPEFFHSLKWLFEGRLGKDRMKFFTCMAKHGCFTFSNFLAGYLRVGDKNFISLLENLSAPEVEDYRELFTEWLFRSLRGFDAKVSSEPAIRPTSLGLLNIVLSLAYKPDEGREPSLVRFQSTEESFAKFKNFLQALQPFSKEQRVGFLIKFLLGGNAGTASYGVMQIVLQGQNSGFPQPLSANTINAVITVPYFLSQVISAADQERKSIARLLAKLVQLSAADLQKIAELHALLKKMNAHFMVAKYQLDYIHQADLGHLDSSAQILIRGSAQEFGAERFMWKMLNLLVNNSADLAAIRQVLLNIHHYLLEQNTLAESLKGQHTVAATQPRNAAYIQIIKTATILYAVFLSPAERERFQQNPVAAIQHWYEQRSRDVVEFDRVVKQAMTSSSSDAATVEPSGASAVSSAATTTGSTLSFVCASAPSTSMWSGTATSVSSVGSAPAPTPPQSQSCGL